MDNKEILFSDITDEELEAAAGQNLQTPFTQWFCTALDYCPGP